MHVKVKFPVALSILSLCLCVVAQLRHSGLGVSAMKENPFPEGTQMPQSGESQHFPEVPREAAFLPSSFPGAEIHRGCTEPRDKWDSAVAKHHFLIPGQGIHCILL